MRARSKAREIALSILYQIEITKKDYHKTLQDYFKDNPAKQEIVDFSSLLAKGVADNMPEIDSLIKRAAKNWNIGRMAVIDRNILRIGCFELVFLDNIPPKVSINESIELAKVFGDIDSPRFVNGVLDKIYREKNKIESYHGKEQ